MELTGETRTVSPGHRISTVLLGLILLVSPLKLANSASSHVFSFFPMEINDLIYGPWPISWAPVLCGLALLTVVGVNGIPGINFFARTWLIWFAPALAFFTCWIGWVGTDNLLQPISFTSHITGILAFSLALLIHTAYCPQSRRALIIFLFAGISLLCLQVAFEYFWSYGNTLAQLEGVIETNGSGSVNQELLSRLRQNRPQAYFPIPNSLAGHLILVTPFLVAVVFKWARHVEPPEVSQIILPGLLILVFGFCVYTTKSRAAVIAILGGLGFLGLCAAVYYRENLHKYRYWYLAGALALPVAGVLIYMAIRDGRSMSSLGARLTYWNYGWQMFCDNPMRGVGIGEFFYHFVKLKPQGAETARLPHSMFIFFASGCGFVGIMAVLTYLLTPAGIFWAACTQRLKVVSPALMFGSLTGLIAWLLHSQADFNVHIPASLMAVSACLILALDTSKLTAAGGHAGMTWLAGVPLVLVALISLAGLLRSPGDYYLAKLEQKLSERRSCDGNVTPLEVLIPLAETGSAWTPGSFLFWERFGSQAMAERRYDLARLAYQEVSIINPHYAAGHFRLAAALAHMREADAARKAFNHGLKWNPYPTDYEALRTALFGAKDK